MFLWGYCDIKWMFFFKKFRHKKVKWCFQSNKKPFFECQIKNLKDSQIFPSAGSLNSSFWAFALCLSLVLPLFHTHTHTHTHTHIYTLFTSPHHLEASHVFSFASLISSTQLAVFSWGKVNNFFHHLRALRCFDKVLLSISVSIKFMSCAFFNIEGLKNNAYFCAYKNEEWLLMQL